MTINELAKYINTHAIHRMSLYNVGVKIVDMRVSYGIPQAKITPITGNGETWVYLSALTTEIK